MHSHPHKPTVHVPLHTASPQANNDANCTKQFICERFPLAHHQFSTVGYVANMVGVPRSRGCIGCRQQKKKVPTLIPHNRLSSYQNSAWLSHSLLAVVANASEFPALAMASVGLSSKTRLKLIWPAVARVTQSSRFHPHRQPPQTHLHPFILSAIGSRTL